MVYIFITSRKNAISSKSDISRVYIISEERRTFIKHTRPDSHIYL